MTDHPALTLAGLIRRSGRAPAELVRAAEAQGHTLSMSTVEGHLAERRPMSVSPSREVILAYAAALPATVHAVWDACGASIGHDLSGGQSMLQQEIGAKAGTAVLDGHPLLRQRIADLVDEVMSLARQLEQARS